MSLEVRSCGRSIVYRDPYTADIVDGELLVLDGGGTVVARFEEHSWELLAAHFDES